MMDELLQQFLVEAPELVAQASGDLAGLARRPGDRALVDSAFRAIHTLKGSVALFDMAPAERALHAAEDLLDRARSGKADLDAPNLDGRDLAALLAVIDETERWIEAMERHGALDGAAASRSQALVARLERAAPAEAATPSGAGADWVESLRRREAAAIADAGVDLVAFRYAPDPDCFFRGDDPLALVEAVPELIALSLSPVEPWAALDAFEPFRCNIVVEGLSAAREDQVRAVFRFMPDQVALARLPAGVEPAAPTALRTLRVEAERIDALAEGLTALIVAGNALAHVAAEAERADPATGARVRAVHAELDRAMGTMREAVTAVRMVSLAPTLRRLPRMVREIAEGLGKPVSFSIAGETTEVDKGVADALYEPLLHIVRNALDHGVETPERRRAAGKPEVAALALDVRREGDQVVVAVSDDGAGMDASRIRETAVARGVLDRTAADAMDDAEALRLVFAPGFSTAAAVSAVSGRGVGLDAVQSVVTRLGGTIEIASTPGLGTAVRLRLPLSAIVTRLLVVRAGGERYGIALDRIAETASLPASAIMPVGTGEACVLRERTVPVLSLAALVGSVEARGATCRLVVTEAAGEPLAVIVDGFEDRLDAVVRPRSGILAGLPGVSGTTLTGDGGVLVVLDLAELAA